jgi:hypothetical protein
MISKDKDKWQQFFKTKIFWFGLGSYDFHFYSFFLFLAPSKKVFEQADIGISEIFLSDETKPRS